ncbi:hypothetical protein PoB_000549500 [Plakobranchus ocellatus]|uniref:Uncharacterized protein n=1 Tax=Plakobranchus ocellatus TaxID=259542 RepID=A0AAV3Y863_9GAST|nr:hypothetical protein PoB_000549500 [Plakobranchus ocellatus]
MQQRKDHVLDMVAEVLHLCNKKVKATYCNAHRFYISATGKRANHSHYPDVPLIMKAMNPDLNTVFPPQVVWLESSPFEIFRRRPVVKIIETVLTPQINNPCETGSVSFNSKHISG